MGYDDILDVKMLRRSSVWSTDSVSAMLPENTNVMAQEEIVRLSATVLETIGHLKLRMLAFQEGQAEKYGHAYTLENLCLTFSHAATAMEKSGVSFEALKENTHKICDGEFGYSLVEETFKHFKQVMESDKSYFLSPIENTWTKEDAAEVAEFVERLNNPTPEEIEMRRQVLKNVVREHLLEKKMEKFMSGAPRINRDLE